MMPTLEELRKEGVRQAVTQLPTSNALSEANSNSLSELFSRNIEDNTDRDWDRIVFILREQRERYIQAEAAGAKTPRPTKLKPILEPPVLED